MHPCMCHVSQNGTGLRQWEWREHVRGVEGTVCMLLLLLSHAMTTCLLAASCRYKVVKQLGDGTYGTVWKAINRQSNEVVGSISQSAAGGLVPVQWGCGWHTSMCLEVGVAICTYVGPASKNPLQLLKDRCEIYPVSLPCINPAD